MIEFWIMLINWRRDERGTLTIEFLLWLPILAFWLVVSAAFFDAYKSRNDAAKAAHTLSDITSRQVVVTDAFLEELFTLQDKLLPRAPEGKLLRVTSIRYSAEDEEYQVLWSEALGGGQPLTDEDIPLSIMPAMADLDSIILTELSVPYQPFTKWARITANTWSFSLISRPRFVSAIAMID
ncbi:MAG TPA: hypothetical protein VMY41_10345 [Thermohalobaculum sp.]|nr:hypothetical protein [Thermohalobaculum sp.]